MFKEVFTYPVLIAFVLIVIHCYKRYGKSATINFFVYGYVWTFIREFFYQNFFSTYEFHGVALKILNVPITIPMGWLFASYLSLQLAQSLTGISLPHPSKDVNDKLSQRTFDRIYFRLLIIACLIQSSISFCIETTALNMEWWRLLGGEFDLAPLFLPLIGWVYTVFITNMLFFLINYPQFRNRANIVLLILCLFNQFYGNLVFTYETLFEPTLYIILIVIFIIGFIVQYLVNFDFSLLIMINLVVGGIIYNRFVLIVFPIDKIAGEVVMSIIGFLNVFLLYIFFNKKEKYIKMTWKLRIIIIPVVFILSILFYFPGL